MFDYRVRRRSGAAPAGAARRARARVIIWQLTARCRGTVRRMSELTKPLVAPADDVVEGKRWVVLLVFSWIEFNQVWSSLRCTQLVLPPSLRAMRLPPFAP